jgi:pyruvate/2-oxoglutarate dehydrogenase complex dihydrolipoamide dehydrogenase (E3) component
MPPPEQFEILVVGSGKGGRLLARDVAQSGRRTAVVERQWIILGFAMIGAEAGEVMAAMQTAMLASLPYPRLRDAVLTHPTMAEGLGSLLAAVPFRS